MVFSWDRSFSIVLEGVSIPQLSKTKAHLKIRVFISDGLKDLTPCHLMLQSSRRNGSQDTITNPDLNAGKPGFRQGLLRKALQECCPSTRLALQPRDQKLSSMGLAAVPLPCLGHLFAQKIFKISCMLVLGQASQKSHIGKVQDQAYHYKGTNLEAEKAAGKQVNRKAGEREEILTVFTQFLGSAKIPLITRENRKIGT